MPLRYLLDENIDPVYRAALHRRQSDLTVWSVGDPGAPQRGTLDPEILLWCEAHGFVLVTNNRKSLPRHLADHLSMGRHVPGLLVLHPAMSTGQVLDELILVAYASGDDEYQDRLAYLPLT